MNSELVIQENKYISINDQNIINKAFFGKDNCLKLTLNKNSECYFHFGLMDKQTKAWVWKKLKFNDMELGQMLLVLQSNKQSASFFHTYKGSKTQIWMNRDKDFVFLKIKEMSKSLSIGEQEVMRVILEYIILRMNMNL